MSEKIYRVSIILEEIRLNELERNTFGIYTGFNNKDLVFPSLT